MVSELTSYFCIKPSLAPCNGLASEHTNPFVLICQSCSKKYKGSNDTMGPVVARAEHAANVNRDTTMFCLKQAK